MNNNLGIAALKAIAKHILILPKKEWDMTYWKKETACGTTSCALGHCLYLPEVQALGDLDFKRNNNGVDEYFYDLILNGEHCNTQMLANIFSISKSDFLHLFGMTKKRTQQQEHDVIMSFVREWEDERA